MILRIYVNLLYQRKVFFGYTILASVLLLFLSSMNRINIALSKVLLLLPTYIKLLINVTANEVSLCGLQLRLCSLLNILEKSLVHETAFYDE